MLTLIMTSPNMAGQITFTYNEAGRITALHISETLKDEQYGWLFRNAPHHVNDVNAFTSRLPSAIFVQKGIEVTFDMFWDRYNDKERSSKKKTIDKWNKMTEANQIKAYLYIHTYNSKRGAAEKKYATTYLNDELWNN